MKKTATLLAFILIGTCALAQWQQMTSMPSDARVIPNIFVIGTNAYIGGGFKTGYVYLSDFWEYNTTNDTWTQKANMPANIGGGAAFAINGKGYIACGWINGSNNAGVHEYDPALNMWTSKNNFPGAARYSSAIFVLNNKAYMGLGYSPLMSDFWEYDATMDTWTQKANFMGGVKEGTVHFALNGLGYVGLGLSNATTYAGTDDFYSYDAGTNTWTQLANFPGPARHSAVSFVINNKAYITTGNTGNASGTTYDDLWEFNPGSLVPWTQLTSLPAGARQSGGAFAVGNCGYVFGGFYQSPVPAFFNDLWRWCATTGVDESATENQVTISVDHNSLQLNIDSKKYLKAHCLFEIYQVDGKKVLTQKITSSVTHISIANLAKGVYMWKFFDDGNVKSGKVVL